MSSYNFFASVYDDLTVNVGYEDRSDYISRLFSKYGVTGDRLLDLACGTGTLTVLLSKKGYQMIGIDASAEMLTVAKSKSDGISYFLQDMRSFVLSDSVDGCICSLDSVNHLNSIDEVGRAFDCVHRSLKGEGIFIFDVNTIYKHQKILDGRTFVFDEKNYFLSWDNELTDGNTVRILLDFFVYNGKNYDRYSEKFFETAYSVEKLTQALSGFEILGVFDDLTENCVKNNSERIYFVCRKK